MNSDVFIRTQSGNALKAAFNLMWDKAIHLNKSAESKEFVSYRDMVRIADAIRAEGPGILSLKKLPNRVDAGLYLAVSIVDPNKARLAENIKKSYSAFGGMSGLALIAVCLGQILNPGVWASLIAIFSGGIASGPLAPVGIAAGITLLVGSIYIATQKMSSKERAVKSHDIFMRCVDEWIKNGDEQDVSAISGIENSMQNALLSSFNNEERSAALSLMSKFAIKNGIICKEKMEIVEQASCQKKYFSLDDAISLDIIKALSLDKRKEFLTWCFAVATVNNELDSCDIIKLKKLAADLNIDYDSIASLYQIETLNDI